MGRAPALIALLAAACGDPDPPVLAGPDAGGEDAPPDADLVNFRFTGTYLDWDSTAAAPCPIAGARWTARHDGSRTATTDDAGAFTLALASYLVELDVEPPAEASPCAAPPGRYDLPAAAIVPPAVFHAGGRFVARSPTMARAAAFYASFGAAFDATRGHLLVHLDGPPRAVSISAPHAPAQAWDGAAWAAGATGADVFFPNVDLTGDEPATVTIAGGAIGAGSVVLPAGALTFMTVIPR